MNWTIEFHPKAKEEFDDLPESIKARLLRLLKKIETNGLDKLPRNSIKQIENGMRELRVSGADGIARSLYVTKTGYVLKILLVFVKKTEETPRRFIDLATQRRTD